jgi:elongation factor P--(R)-beta-lysine ligase
LEKPGERPDKKPILWLRARMLQAIRRFFFEKSYLEVHTPCLIPAPAPEPHIDAIKAGTAYLHTSPELCMKRLLSAGHARLFQICPCFRQAERGSQHLPEFALLEWYRAGIDYWGLMDECEKMILAVSKELGLGEEIEYQSRRVFLQRPWHRLPVAKAFDAYAGMSMEKALESGTFDHMMVDKIEPSLGAPRPTFLYDYPASVGALASLKKDNPEVAERFELYMGGLEIANAFSELNDPHEQRARFEAERERRRVLGKPAYPMPEKFLRDLERMPQSAGIALGIDRLVMLFADTPCIDDVVSFTPEDL